MKPSPLHIGTSLTLIALGVLAVVYTAQYGFGLAPCPLCLYQRVPYFIVAALGIALMALRKYQTGFLVLAALTFAVGAGIAGFHAGVEYKWWKGLESCAGTLPENATLEQLRAAISGAPVVRCDEPAWTLFGISMAGYNFLFSLLLFFGCLMLARRLHAKN